MTLLAEPTTAAPADPTQRPTATFIAPPIEAPETVAPATPLVIDLVGPDAALAMSEHTPAELLALVDAGELAAYRLGGEVRFRRRDVEALRPRRIA